MQRHARKLHPRNSKKSWWQNPSRFGWEEDLTGKLKCQKRACQLLDLSFSNPLQTLAEPLCWASDPSALPNTTIDNDMQSQLLNNHRDDRFYRIPSSFISIRVDDKAGAEIADIEGNSFKNWILARLLQKLWENVVFKLKRFILLQSYSHGPWKKVSVGTACKPESSLLILGPRWNTTGRTADLWLVSLQADGSCAGVASRTQDCDTTSQPLPIQYKIQFVWGIVPLL